MRWPWLVAVVILLASVCAQLVGAAGVVTRTHVKPASWLLLGFTGLRTRGQAAVGCGWERERATRDRAGVRLRLWSRVRACVRLCCADVIALRNWATARLFARTTTHARRNATQRSNAIHLWWIYFKTQTRRANSTRRPRRPAALCVRAALRPGLRLPDAHAARRPAPPPPPRGRDRPRRARPLDLGRARRPLGGCGAALPLFQKRTGLLHVCLTV